MTLITIGCTNGSNSGNISDADSIYQWEYIRKYLDKDQEYSLKLIDTAEMRKLIDVNKANYWRARVYFNAEKNMNYDRSKEYCMKVLDNTKPAPDSTLYIRVLNLLVGINRLDQRTYPEAIQYAMEGAQRAHNAGDITFEANFYSDLGNMMEKTRPGSGAKYMERSLNILREASDNSYKNIPFLATCLGNTARRMAERDDYANAVKLLKEKLHVIDRFEKECTTAPEGYCDEERAKTYGVLASCLWKTGNHAEAKKIAEAYEKYKHLIKPTHWIDIINYYSMSGDGEHTQQTYDLLEPIIREKYDTISNLYIGLLHAYASGISKVGRYQDAYKVLNRRAVLADSMEQRILQQETLKFAQQMETQEKEMELMEKEAEGRLHFIIIISLSVLLTASIIFLWRIILAKTRLHEKNRELFETVQQMMKEEQRQLELSELPSDTLSAPQQLYNRICQLMREKQLYTDSDLNRESLADAIGTNYNAIAAAIKECTDGQTIGNFIDDWRLRHAADLLRDTNNAIGLIVEQSGFASRSHFSSLFRNKFKMTPSEYRIVATEKKES